MDVENVKNAINKAEHDGVANNADRKYNADDKDNKSSAKNMSRVGDPDLDSTKMTGTWNDTRNTYYINVMDSCDN